MCKSAVSQKLDFAKQLHTVLQGEVKPMITQCCIHELYLQGKEQQPAVDLAKGFERRKCNHREPIPGDDCLTSVVGEKNKHRYVVATQSHPLRVKLRSVPGTPIIHINRSVVVLEPPSDVTLKAKEATEEQSLHATSPDLALVPATTEERRVKRKGPKGPNPLSVKKKKVEPPKPQKDQPKKPSHSNVTIGTKRKAEEVEEDHEGGSEGENHPKDGQSQTATPASKRRKRRRKHQATASVAQTAEPNDSII